MSLVTMKYLLEQAKREHRAVGAFNTGSMEMVEGVIRAAEETGTPVILQHAESRFKVSPIELMGPMMIEAAKESKVDIAVHLDHGATFETVKKVIGYGFTSVMFDGSKLPFEENIEKVKKVVDYAYPKGVTVEAELGTVGKNEDGTGTDEIQYTDPDDAGIFCERTGIDCLAVAIGNAHGNYKGKPKLAFDVLKKIREKTDTMLVLHGGTGIADEDFRKLIEYGIVKINIATANFDSATRGAKDYISGTEDRNFFGLSESMRDEVYKNVLHHIKVFNCREPL